VGHESGGRGHVDDGAASVFEHVCQFGFHAVEDAGEVDLDDLFPIGDVDFVDVDQDRSDSGVVERDVQAAVGRDRMVDDALHVVEAGDVGGDRRGLGVGVSNLGGDAFGGIGVAVGDDDARAVGGESLGGRLAEAGPAAGHDADSCGVGHGVCSLWLGCRRVKTAPAGSAKTAMVPISIGVGAISCAAPLVVAMTALAAASWTAK
jgi:hypothetical protein